VKEATHLTAQRIERCAAMEHGLLEVNRPAKGGMTEINHLLLMQKLGLMKVATPIAMYAVKACSCLYVWP
jgi:hypothetical protein